MSERLKSIVKVVLLVGGSSLLIALFVLLFVHVTGLDHCPVTNEEAFQMYGGLDQWRVAQDVDGKWFATLNNIPANADFAINLPVNAEIIFGPQPDGVNMDVQYRAEGPTVLSVKQDDTGVENAQTYIVNCSR